LASPLITPHCAIADFSSAEACFFAIS